MTTRIMSGYDVIVIGSGAAGVISGSAIVARASEGPVAVRDFVASMKAATKR